MLTLRAPRPDDAETLGRICFEAFASISDAHSFPRDFPSPEAGAGFVTFAIAHPGVFGIVAEEDGRVIGSNFLDERGPICGVGPITVDPKVQNGGVGRRLMQAVLDRAAERNAPGVRLVQAGFHSRSLSLYTKLGFDVREHLSCMTGRVTAGRPTGGRARQATMADAEACNRLCLRVHGHERAGELSDAIGQGTALVVERAGRITGYASQITFFGHAVGETSEDVEALIAEAGEIGAPGILVPSRNGDLFRWCLDHGLRVTQTLTLMTRGLYNEPAGAWMPSVLY